MRLLRYQPRSQYRNNIRATIQDYRTSSLHPVTITSFIHSCLIQPSQICYQLHVPYLCLHTEWYNQLYLTNFYPARKLFNWHAPPGKLINGSITLHLKIESKGSKLVIIMVVIGMAVEVLKPGWDSWTCDKFWLLNAVLARLHRLWGWWYWLKVHRPWGLR